jgi:hypothetical protein
MNKFKNTLLLILLLSSSLSFAGSNYKCKRTIKSNIERIESDLDKMEIVYAVTAPISVLFIGIQVAVDEKLNRLYSIRDILHVQNYHKDFILREFTEKLNRIAKTRLTMLDVESFFEAQRETTYFCETFKQKIKPNNKFMRELALDIQNFTSKL